MNPALRIAASGMAAQNHRVQTIANNISNVGTHGFKASEARFQDLLYQEIQAPRAQSLPDMAPSAALQAGRGVRLSATMKSFDQGPLDQTGRSLDLAIEGEGFLMAELPDGTRGYTRSGDLRIDAHSGALVTQEGHILTPQIEIPVDAQGIGISPEGIVTATYDDQFTEEIGQIELARFLNPEGLYALGGSMYLETDASGQAIEGLPGDLGFGSVLQGALEGSNVDVVSEMVAIIEAMRGYEMSMRAATTADQMSEQANGLVR